MNAYDKGIKTFSKNINFREIAHRGGEVYEPSLHVIDTKELRRAKELINIYFHDKVK